MSAARRRVAVVTGGGRGIGQAIVDRLLGDGFQVMACGRSSRPEDLPAEAGWTKADVSSDEQASRVVRDTIGRFGSVSILVNNAGVQVEKTVADTTNEDWDLVVGTNCRGVFNMCRAVLPVMRDTGGCIVNIGSISGVMSDRSMALYNASKSFVHGLTRSIAVDHGPEVRCNAIRPGWIMTGMAENAFSLAADPLAAKADALARHAAGRFGMPEDIAHAVAWLVSDRAAFVTGQCFTIDGGLTAASPIQPELF